ncbi:hypothetical protein TSOC_008135 [Tetrabaena socialis]|uniref:Sulfotransferase n=1 Tax=Tetrabaena socialis TaxID=47790 RepID=A0A2J7ZZ71_9CHLO|nr:hypothetical protein TSOC_008135 [Tetrabaena socialis]|eukprot:PNH05574.1 hypothetical protein TSOC_008135 [Tetrabaena socialis]
MVAMVHIVSLAVHLLALPVAYSDRMDLNQLLMLGGLGSVGAAAQPMEADPATAMAAVTATAAQHQEQALERLLHTATADASLLLPPGHDSFVANSFGSLVSMATALAQDTMPPERVELHLIGLSNALETFPRTSSFPGLRRVVVASLALRRLRHGPFADEHLKRCTSLLLQLFDQHRDAATRKRAIEFAHISKAGGTSICSLAERNGCTTESFAPNRNCQLPVFRDQPRYINATQHAALRGRAKTHCQRPTKPMSPRSEASCEKRRQYLLSKGYTIYANEYTAFGGSADPGLAHPCSNMMTVLQIRHPHDRVISHINHVFTMYERHCHEDRGLYFAKGHDTADWALLIPAPVNNYMIRSLLGEAVFNLPADNQSITEEHLELACNFLAQQYDVLLVLEESDMSARTMRAGLGWQSYELHVNGKAPEPEDGLPTNLELLWELNRLDLQLYEYGVAMARLDAVVFSVAEALLPDMPRAQAAQPPPPALATAAAAPTVASNVIVAAAGQQAAALALPPGGGTPADMAWAAMPCDRTGGCSTVKMAPCHIVRGH